MPDPRSPLMAGAGQICDDPSASDPARPRAMMAEASRRAVADAGAAGEALLSRCGAVAVVNCLGWAVADPAKTVASDLGIDPAERLTTPIGGTSPASLLSELCEAIASGDLDVALLVGADSVTKGLTPDADGADVGSQPTRVVGEHRDPSHPSELAAGLYAPVNYYPLFETAIRASAGRTQDEHREWLGRLWGRLAGVAGENPHAWTQDPPTAEEIATPGPGNRPVSHPYLKWMNANVRVRQGAALLLCSADAADGAGLDADRRVFVHSVAQGHDHWFAGEREALDRSPAVGACGRAALGHAGVGIDDVAELDLYSCFPSAVQIAAGELGIDPVNGDRPPTVTGGLTFAGGPVNNYVTHALATLNGRLRERPEEYGLSTAVGWYMSKHASALMSARPPSGGFRRFDVQADVDPLPRRAIADAGTGDGVLEAYTAGYDADGNVADATVTAIAQDGSRIFARTDDAALARELLDADPIGSAAVRGGALTLD